MLQWAQCAVLSVKLSCPTHPGNSRICHPWKCSWPEWRWGYLPRDGCHWTPRWIQHPLHKTGFKTSYVWDVWIIKIYMCMKKKNLRKKRWRVWEEESGSYRLALQCSSPLRGCRLKMSNSRQFLLKMTFFSCAKSAVCTSGWCCFAPQTGSR